MTTAKPILFADSIVGVAVARAGGCPKGAEIRTAAPALLACEPAARQLDAGIDAEILASLGDSVRALTIALHQAALEVPLFAPNALTLARCGADFQRAVAKAMCLGEDVFAGPVTVMDVETGNGAMNARFNSLLGALLRDHSGVTRHVVPAERVPPLAEVWHARAPWRTRLAFEPWQSLLYRVLMRLGTASPRGAVLVHSENSLVKETAAHLALRGFALRLLTRPKPSRQALADDEVEALRALILPPLEALLDGRVIERLKPILRDMFTAQASDDIARYRAALPSWREQLRRWRKPRAVLMSSTPSPESEAMYAAARERDLPVFAFQHGTAHELSRIGQYAQCKVEVGATDHLFCFNRESAKVMQASPFSISKAHTAGLPRDLALLARPYKDLGLPPVFYVSCQLMAGNVQYPTTVGIPDCEIDRVEGRMVDEVLARLPHEILFKPYPSLRYLDENPVYERIRAKPNITLFEDWFDLRYLLRAARLIICGKGGSTVSWCLLADRPMVFINTPDQTPLFPKVREAFEPAVFVFDANDDDFHDRLRSFLSQPLADIEAQWRQRREARAALTEEYFGPKDGHAGKRAARFIHKVLGS